MSDTPRMAEAWPEGRTRIYYEGQKLERELAAVTAERDGLRAMMEDALMQIARPESSEALSAANRESRILSKIDDCFGMMHIASTILATVKAQEQSARKAGKGE